MDYRSIIESRYNRENWQKLLYDIFGRKVQFWQQPQRVTVDESMAKSALYTGKITLPDGHLIAIYEVELSDSVVIERNRAGIRNLLCTSWRSMGCAGAFMFCFRKNEAVLRFSYVSEAFAFTEDGALKKERTDTKRFTYLLGEGHRSRTAIDQFLKLKASGLTLKDITKAFSVEALSDSFFKEYKKHYEDIIEYITGKRMVKVSNKWEEQVTGEPCEAIMQEFSQFPDAEKAVRDYVKKLMGRLVFIQFLQKKGWMGCSAGEAWNDGDSEFVQNLFANTEYKNTFVDDVLEPLFDDINTKRDGDIANAVLGTGIKVPYLNGGLFEHDDYDETAFPLPAKYMKSLLDFFSSYNFTIDENDPDDAEIGVDPEMLGRIFENLLEDNKDKGAFYTPKEIVQYMCRESLIAYLQTDIEDEAAKEAIRQFATKYDAAVLSEEQKTDIDQKLKDVKICDPAIGSGAFPMGLLRELYACRKAIEGIDDETAVRIKTEIIQNNIYGVDIEKGAVDIARLRFWLALIVDEKTPHALPNMDFKIMQGNSLLEQYEGVDLSGMSLTEQRKRKAKKGDAYQTMLAFDESIALENIQKAIKQYYLTDSHDAKVALRKTIDGNVKSYILNLKGCTPDIQRKLENLPIPNDQFFLWHIYFKEVFDKGGFDIVIGNPPYINVELIPQSDKDIYKKTFKCFYKRSDIFALFLENALLSMSSSKAAITFIIPSVVHSNLSYQPLRDIILNNKWLKEVCYTGGKVFDAPTVDTTILIMHKIGNDSINLKNAVNFNKHESHTVPADYFSVFKNVISIGDGSTDGIFAKLFDQRLPVMEDVVTIFQGIVTGNNPAFTFETVDDALDKGIEEILLHPMCHGIDIERYAVRSRERQMLYIDNSVDIENYPGSKKWLIQFKEALDKRNEGKHDTISWCSLHRPRVKEELDNKEKILVQNTRNESLKTRIVATLDDMGVYGTQGLNFIIQRTDEYSLRFILGILNSNLMNYLFSTKFLNLAIKAEFLKQIRLPKAIESEIMQLESLVDRILSAKKSNPLADTTSLEHEIDRLVYDLYGLTEDEIRIVEGGKETDDTIDRN